MYLKISVTKSPIIPPYNTPWIFPGILLGIFLRILSGISAGEPQEILLRAHPGISMGTQLGNSLKNTDAFS